MEEARKYLSSCAKLNGRPVGEDSLSQEVRVQESAQGRVEGVSECPSSWALPCKASSPVESSELQNTPCPPCVLPTQRSRENTPAPETSSTDEILLSLPTRP